MKKVLPFILASFFFGLTANAQSLILASEEIPIYANTSDASVLKSGNGITISQIGTAGATNAGINYIDVNNSNSSLVLNSTSNDAVTISSGSNIEKIVLTYSGNNSANTPNPYIGFHSESTPMGSSNAVVSSCTMDATGVTGTTMVAKTYTAPANTKFIIIVRGKACDPAAANGATARISRIEVFLTGTTPIKLTSFKAASLQGAIKLSWTTVFESNSDKFIVERRSDNSEFEALATIKAAGNSNKTVNYTSLDNTTIPNTNYYYRLKSVDKDGSFTYSEVVALKNSLAVSENTLSVSPNPANTPSVSVSHPVASASASIKVVNLQGQLVASASPVAGDTKTTVGISDLAAGLYIVSFENGGAKLTYKFVKK